MASPSAAEVQAQLKAAAGIVESLRSYAAGTYLGEEDTLVQAAEGDLASLAIGVVKANIRSLLANGLSDSNVASVLTPAIREYGLLIGSPATEPSAILDDLFTYFTDNSVTVQSRDVSLTTPAAGGSNVGNGVMYRLKVDAAGNDLEAQTLGDKTCTCIRDNRSGAPTGAEIFRLTDEAVKPDRITIGGSGEVVEMAAMVADGGILQNPSFSTWAGAAATLTSVSGWTTDSGNWNAFEVTTSGTYRPSSSQDTTPYAMIIDGNDILIQDLSTRRMGLDPKVPIFVQVAVKRTNSCDGTLTVRWGAVSASVDMTTLTNGVWSTLRIGVDEDNWFENFNENSFTFEIELASRTTGEAVVDDVIVRAMTPYDGDWYAIVGGTTPFVVGDVFTMGSDSEHASNGVIQRLLHRGFRKYLPATTGTPTITDP